jgi:hypothetical protein
MAANDKANVCASLEPGADEIPLYFDTLHHLNYDDSTSLNTLKLLGHSPVCRIWISPPTHGAELPPGSLPDRASSERPIS